ncbi:MAG: hypothetical protein COB30_004055 [Ectothiorhodospiraceae bacterium]|nr:hypothetical protein [Ectothiorhodospiraceae bacterium]
MKNNLYKSVLLAALLMFTAGAFADEVIVIVHPSNPLTEISINDLKKIYLGKKKFFPNGGKVIPVDQKRGTESRKFFYGGIIGKSETKLKSYWARLIFTGRGTPPKVIKEDVLLKKWVADQPKAIGYMMSNEVDNTVKVLELK